MVNKLNRCCFWVALLFFPIWLYDRLIILWVSYQTASGTGGFVWQKNGTRLKPAVRNADAAERKC
jgi:hypothetical protein